MAEMGGRPGNPDPAWKSADRRDGDYYRKVHHEGALTGDLVVDGPRVFVRADNDERTIETGRILGKALVSGRRT